MLNNGLQVEDISYFPVSVFKNVVEVPHDEDGNIMKIVFPCFNKYTSICIVYSFRLELYIYMLYVHRLNNFRPKRFSLAVSMFPMLNDLILFLYSNYWMVIVG